MSPQPDESQPNMVEESKQAFASCSRSPSDEATLHSRLEKLQSLCSTSWDGLDDPEDPYNWSTGRKILIGIIYSIGQLITLMSSGMMSSALDDISYDLDLSASRTQLASSIYFLGLALGPIPIAAWSELAGRKNAWMWCNAWYILWNALAPVGNSPGLMMVSRLMSGIGASAGITLTQPALADMYGKSNRGKSIAIGSLLPYLGPSLGPIVGGVATRYITWHWLFWILSIADFAILALGILFIKESYSPVLLLRRRNHHRHDSPCSSASTLRSILTAFSANVKRTVMLLTHQPVIQITALVMALNFGTYCLILSTLALLFISRYDQDPFSASLHYLALSVGATISAQLGGRLMDHSYRRLRQQRRSDKLQAKNSSNAEAGGGGSSSEPQTKDEEEEAPPELRAPYMLTGSVLSPIGLLWYGWSAYCRLPWIMPDLGVAVFTCGNFMFSQGMVAYQLDAFGELSASASAASRIFSYLVGLVFPVFAPAMYGRLGYGWGDTLLAFLFVGIVVPTPVVFWFFGARLRGMERRVDSV